MGHITSWKEYWTMGNPCLQFTSCTSSKTEDLTQGMQRSCNCYCVCHHKKKQWTSLDWRWLQQRTKVFKSITLGSDCFPVTTKALLQQVFNTALVATQKAQRTWTSNIKDKCWPYTGSNTDTASENYKHDNFFSSYQVQKSQSQKQIKYLIFTPAWTKKADVITLFAF